MATRTSVGSGLWSAAGTWDTGVPADNDVVVISSGHTVEFDADMSNAGTWPNGIDGITITGTLKLTRTAGVYYLKIKAAKTIGGAGTFDCGTLVSPIPFAAKHTITGGAAWYIQGSGGLTMTVYAAEPAIKTVLLTGAESVGATVLEVDTSVIGDIWADGDTIRIDDVNGNDSESRIIATSGIAAGSITVTAGLTNAKIAGALVNLITRNVRIVGNGGHTCMNFAAGKLTIAGGEWTANAASYRVLNACTQATISGGAFAGNMYIMYSCSKSIISGGIFSGNSTVAVITPGLEISGGSFSGGTDVVNQCTAAVSGGSFRGCSQPFSSCVGLTISGGTITGNTYGLYSCSASIKNAVFGSNTSDFYRCVIFAYNTLLGSTTENSGYTDLAKQAYSESVDHDQVAGAYRAWTRGGVTTKQATTYPTGYTAAMQTVLENAAVEGYWQREVTVGAGASINFDLWLRKSASMTYLPRCLIFNKASTDPFAGGTALKTFTMTDSVDTWENDSWTYTNSTSEDVTLVVRFLGMDATGNVYSALTAEQINVDLTSVIDKLDMLTTDTIPDSYAADGDQPTLRQAVLAILQFLTEKSVSGTTVTVNKPDGATEAMTLTLDSATAPTSITRAT